MKKFYQDPEDPFVGMNLKHEIRVGLSLRMQAIEQAHSTTKVHLTTERAEGFIDGLESARVLNTEQIFKIRQIIESTAQARTMVLIL